MSVRPCTIGSLLGSAKQLWVDAPWNCAIFATSLLSQRNSISHALRLGWSDSHTTGIYTFRFLRQLHALTELPLEEAKKKEFSR